MEYPQMERAARRLLIDQGLPSAGAVQTVLTVVKSPESVSREDGVPLTLEDCAAFETWAATLDDTLLDIACCGCDETPENGPITYTDGTLLGSEGCVSVIIPDNCCRVLEALFDNLFWSGM